MISLKLTKDNFENAMYTQLTESNCTIVFNAVNEHWTHEDTSVEVNGINMEIHQQVEDSILIATLSNIIGFKNDFVDIVTDYDELNGKRLTLDNIDKCSILVYDTLLKE